MLRSRFSSYSCIVLCFVILQGTVVPRVAIAQDGRDVLGGLLQELVRSQLERRERKRRESMRPQPGQLAPGQPPAARPVITQKMRQAQQYCNSFSTECDRLAGLLRRDAQRTPGLRVHLDQVLKLKARSALMSQRFAQPRPESVVMDDIRELDRDWRLAAFQLNQVRGLSSDCQQSVKRLDGYNQQCCKLYDIAPQVDRRELVRLADALAAEIHHLEQDVEHELRGNRNAGQFLLQLRRIEARARLLADSFAENDPYDSVVGEFKQLMIQWNSISHTIEALNDRHIERTELQIHEITRAIYTQLHLQVAIDHVHLQHLSTVTQQHVKELSDMLTLTVLVQLPDAQAVLKSAQGLHATTNHICDCIIKKESQQDIIEDWQALHTSWREFDHHTQNIDSPRIRTLRQEITAHVDAMRTTLGIQLVFDRREVVRLAAALDGIAEQAHYHVGQWQKRPGANVDAGLIRSAKRLIVDCHHMHEECAGTASREHLLRDCNKLVADWARLRPQLARCNTVDKATLMRISDQATAHLIRLQTMLES